MVFQTFAVWSLLAVARREPSRENATQLTPLVWPVRVQCQTPVKVRVVVSPGDRDRVDRCTADPAGSADPSVKPIALQPVAAAARGDLPLHRIHRARGLGEVPLLKRELPVEQGDLGRRRVLV